VCEKNEYLHMVNPFNRWHTTFQMSKYGVEVTRESSRGYEKLDAK